MNAEISAELNRIAAANNGVLNPAKVVEAARHKDSPIHNQFTWDNTRAAELYRLEEARRMIRVVVIVDQTTKKETRAWVSLSTERHPIAGGYRRIEKVSKNPISRAQMLADAIAEMQYFRTKYGRLRELADVFAAMDRIKPKGN